MSNPILIPPNPDRVDRILDELRPAKHQADDIMSPLIEIVKSGAMLPSEAAEKAGAEGRERGIFQVQSTYDRIKREVGDAAARNFINALRPQLDKDAKIAAKEKARLDADMKIMDAQISHMRAAREVLRDGPKLRPRAFIVGNQRLLAHEVLEQINTPMRCLLLGLNSKERPEKDYFLEYHRLLINSGKFDIRSILPEDIEPNETFSHELESHGLFHLPYPACWFEWEIEPGHVVAAVGREGDGRVTFSSLVRLAGFGWAAWDLTNDTDWNPIKAHVESVTRAATVIIGSLVAKKTEIVSSDRLNRRREALGKPPLFSHTVIEISGVVLDKNTGAVIGRTRRSPRMHWRRGHLRRFRNAAGDIYRVTPIAPMLVGRADLGRIEHDYTLAAPRAVHRNNGSDGE